MIILFFKGELEKECEDLRDQLEELQCGERQQPEGSVTIRGLPTIQEEEPDSPSSRDVSEEIEKDESSEPREDACPGRDDDRQLGQLHARIKQLIAEAEALADARRNLETEIATVKQEKDSTKQQLAEAQLKLGNLSNLETEAASLRSNNATLNRQLTDLHNIYKDADQVLEQKVALEKEVEKLRNKIEEMNIASAQVQALMLEKRLFDAKYLEMQFQLRDKDEIIKYLNDKIDTIQAHNITVTTKDDPDVKVAELQKNLDRIRAQLIYKDDELDQYVLGLRQIAEAFGIETDDLRNVYINIKQAHNELKSKLKEKEEMVEELTNKQSEDVKKLKKTIIDCYEEMNNLKLKDVLNHKKYEKINDRNNELNNLVEEKNALSNSLREDNVKLNKNLDKEKIRYATLETNMNNTIEKIEGRANKTMDELNKVTESLNKEMNKNNLLCTEKTKINDALEDEKQKCIKLEKEISDIVTKNEKLGQKLEETIGDKTKDDEKAKLIEEYEEKIKSNESKVKELEQAMLELEKTLETKEFALKAEKSDLLVELNKLKESASEKEKQVADTDSDFKKLSEEKETLAQQIVVFTTERQQLIDALNQKHQENVSYHAEMQKFSQLLTQEREKNYNDQVALTKQLQDEKTNYMSTCKQLEDMKLKASDNEKSSTEIESLKSQVIGFFIRKIFY